MIRSSPKLDLETRGLETGQKPPQSVFPARLHELEEQHERTFFEIGGVLSAIQKNKWLDPFASLDEWVEKKHRPQPQQGAGLWRASVLRRGGCRFPRSAGSQTPGESEA